MTRQIPLTQGKFALVDDEDFERVSKFKWHASKGSKTFYARRNSLKSDNIEKRITIRLHCFILGFPVNTDIDHIDRNGLNCCRSNLRRATPSQNRANRGLDSTNTTGYKGISFIKRRNRWRMRITVDGKKIEKDGFHTAEQAARAYDSFSKKHFGEFAVTNFADSNAQ